MKIFVAIVCAATLTACKNWDTSFAFSYGEATATVNIKPAAPNDK